MSPSVETAVRELLGEADWTVSATAGGSAGRSFIATRGEARAFVKVDVDASLLRYLADLGVSPRVITSRPFGDGDAVVQTFVDGSHPDGRWVDEHIEQVADVFAACHRAVAAHGRDAATLAPDGLLGSLVRRVRASTIRPSERASIRVAEVLDSLAATVPTSPAEPVLTHGDPNTENLLLDATGRLYVLDWDDARLSDPVRDLGQLLWWYVRRERWTLGLRACALHDDADVIARIHWWSAAESLEVALGEFERGRLSAAMAFLDDAAAAAGGLDNPRGWWRGTLPA